jgi:hypothetical protein
MRVYRILKIQTNFCVQNQLKLDYSFVGCYAMQCYKTFTVVSKEEWLNFNQNIKYYIL